MVIKIRLARFGKRNAPFYNIVVAQARYISPTLPVPRPYPLPKTPFTTNSPSEAPETVDQSKSSVAFPTDPRTILSTITKNYKPGTYDPIPKPAPTPDAKPYKDIKIDTSRAKYWLGVGAQPSDPMWRLLALMGLMEPRFGVKGGNVAAGGEKGEEKSAEGR